MRLTSKIGTLALAGALLASGCSSGSSSPSSDRTPAAAHSMASGPPAPAPAECAHFTTRVKDVHAALGTLVSAAAVKHYRIGTPVEESKISLTRLQPGRSAITPAVGSTLTPMSLLTEVVRTWNRTRASGPAFPTINLDTRNDRISIGASGTTKVQASPIVWYRGWRTLTGTFRWSSCGSDGTPVWGEGTFTALGVPSTGGAACGPPSDSIDAVAKAALALECG